MHKPPSILSAFLECDMSAQSVEKRASVLHMYIFTSNKSHSRGLYSLTTKQRPLPDATIRKTNAKLRALLLTNARERVV